MVKTSRARYVRAGALLIASGLCLLSAARAKADYTFTTLAGVPEAGPGWYDGTNSAARFNKPLGVAVDSAGNAYVADAFNHTIRKITAAGEVKTLAGLAGSSGSTDGAGGAARLNSPSSVALDSSNNVYVADTYNHTIRKITPAGTVTTLAGLAGALGSADGTGSAARFYYPCSVAVDGGGNVYVADSNNHTIRKITPAGAVTTLAGLAGNAGTNNGTGTTARFNYPFGVAVDRGTNVYVADSYNDTVRKITPARVVTTLAGLAGNSGTNNGTGSAARFNTPGSVAVDSATNVYVADTYNHTIRKVTPAGVVTTPAGLAGYYGSADGTNSAARFYDPCGVAVDGGNIVFIADAYNHAIRKMTPAGEVTTLAGSAVVWGNADGTGSAARFQYPESVAADSGGNVYVADTYNHTIRKITLAGTVTTLAGTTNSGSANGIGGAARFNGPTSVAVDGAANVYVADAGNNMIRKISPAGEVTTLAGTTNSGSANGTGSAARFNSPGGVAVDSATNVYVADTYNHTIRKITPDGTVTTLAGLAGNAGSADGTNGTARFKDPYAVAVDSSGTVYVADTWNYTIRKITSAGVVTTLAGLAGTFGSTDGTNSVARFYFPCGVAADNAGTVFVADFENHTVRKLTPAGAVTTLAGAAGNPGSADGTDKLARFNFLFSVAVDGSSNLYVADTYNHTIRKGNPTLPDTPVVDPPAAVPGAIRHLDVTNLTTTSWNWRLIRCPAGSSAQLSSTTNRNPALTPDVPDVFVVRFEGRDNLGRVAIGTVSVVADATPPALSIVSPTAGQRWSNAVFVVTGTASDNAGLASVRCQINGGDWTNAVGTTNWTASVRLTPGTNVVRAFAVDTSGQASATSNVSLVYAAFTPVVVQLNGRGSVTPNYSGQALEVWKTYSMTAAAGTGFTFTNWTGGTSLPLSVLTNGTAVRFVMQSNLILQANFRDVTKPAVTITAPTAGQRLSNAVVTVRGTATDNGQVASVWCQLNSNNWASATGTTNWLTMLALPAGTNVIRVYSLDTGGNRSSTNSVTCVASNTFLLRLGFNSVQPLTQTGLVLRLDASLNLNGSIEVSTNLANWTSLTNFISTNSLILIRDPAATNYNRRFYRAVVR